MPKHFAHQSADADVLMAERDRFCAAIFSTNTTASYTDSWRRFETWCASMSRTTLPATPETVALWATSMLRDGLKVTTVEVRICGVSHYHKRAGLKSPIGPEVRQVVNGARRLRREKPEQKRALTADQLWKISRLFDRTPRGLRDRAIVVLGFAGGFRRSELTSLDLSDVEFVRRGLLIRLRWSKTDQEGLGREVGIFRGDKSDTCPVRTLESWIGCRGTQPGPLFFATSNAALTDRRMTSESIALVVKRAVKSIGLDAREYAGHSLRAGYVTEAAENGATELSIMARTGHKTVSILHKYFRPTTAFGRNPLAGRL